MSFDLTIFQFLHSFVGGSVIFDNSIIFLAKYLPYILILAAGYFILEKKVWKERIFIFIFIALSVILSRSFFSEIIRLFYHKLRPFLVLNFEPLLKESTFAFPSGHAAFFFALALAIFYFDKKWGYWFLGAALINGIARVFAGVHWPYDIIGGALVAYLSFVAVNFLLKSYETRKDLSD